MNVATLYVSCCDALIMSAANKPQDIDGGYKKQVLSWSRLFVCVEAYTRLLEPKPEICPSILQN